jgi:hypothetical protein
MMLAPDPNAEPTLLTLELTPELEAQVCAFGAANGIDSDDEAIRQLIEAGLESRREARRRG